MKPRNKRLGLVLMGLFFLLASHAYSQETGYVGAERCRSCHAKAFEIWSRTPHSTAQKLVPAERKTELRCLFCHSTDAPVYLAAYSLPNVQCEACHGPGGRHVVLALRAAETDKKVAGLEAMNEQKCRTCHTTSRSSTIRPFNYETALQKIRHW